MRLLVEQIGLAHQLDVRENGEGWCVAPIEGKARVIFVEIEKW
jgi:hypothetical protein